MHDIMLQTGWKGAVRDNGSLKLIHLTTSIYRAPSVKLGFEKIMSDTDSIFNTNIIILYHISVTLPFWI